MRGRWNRCYDDDDDRNDDDDGGDGNDNDDDDGSGLTMTTTTVKMAMITMTMVMTTTTTTMLLMMTMMTESIKTMWSSKRWQKWEWPTPAQVKDFRRCSPNIGHSGELVAFAGGKFLQI